MFALTRSRGFVTIATVIPLNIPAPHCNNIYDVHSGANETK